MAAWRISCTAWLALLCAGGVAASASDFSWIGAVTADRGGKVDPSCDIMPDRDNTIPLMPGVPMIPYSARSVLTQSCNVTVDYTFYFDYNTQKCSFTTEEQLAAAEALTKPSWEKVVSNDLCEVIFILLLAYLYKTCVADARPAFPESPPPGFNMRDPPQDFHYALCSCCSDGRAAQTSIAACCLAPIRAADTYSAAGVMSYWQVVGVFLGVRLLCAALEVLLYGVVPFDKTGVLMLIISIVFTIQRHALRQKLGASDRPTQQLVMDFLLWGCCSCCVVVQEAREVDTAQNVEVKYGCCGIVKLGGGAEVAPLVGYAVQTNNAYNP